MRNDDRTCTVVGMSSRQPLIEAAKWDIKERYTIWCLPARTPLSVRFPRLTPLILYVRRNVRLLREHFSSTKFARVQRSPLAFLQYESSSLLRRRLGASDPLLQEGKIVNLRRALPDISGIVIYPGEVFSLWQLLGNTTVARGYVEGMVLSRGKVGVGVGGGLCQLANLLHWVFLHTPMTVTERFHHSYDVFPDNGRSLPFGSGATIFYNLIDLQVQNTSAVPWQIVFELTEETLSAQVRTVADTGYRYKIKEEQHAFVSAKNTVFRYNQIWRRTSTVSGDEIKYEQVCTNFAPVMYSVTNEQISYSIE